MRERNAATIDPPKITSSLAGIEDIALFQESRERKQDPDGLLTIIQKNAEFLRDVKNYIESLTDSQTWNKTFKKIADFDEYAEIVHNQWVGKKNELTFGQTCLYFAAYSGSLLAIDNLLDQLDGIAARHNLKEKVEREILVARQTVTECLEVKFGQVCLRDFLTTIRAFPTSCYYEFLVRAGLYPVCEDYQLVVGENKDNILANFPQDFEVAAGKVYGITVALMNLSSDEIGKSALVVSKIDHERISLRFFSKLTDKITGLREEFFSVLTNPQSPDFKDLSVKFLEFVKMNDLAKQTALVAAGLDSPANFVKLFRYSKECIASGVEVEFYEKVYQILRETINDDVSNEDIFGCSRYFSRFNFEETETVLTPPNIEDIKRIFEQIFSKSSAKLYELKAEDVEWGKLPRPESVKVELERYERKIKIALVYTKGDGNNVTLDLVFFLKDGSFDWSLLESPGDPDVRFLKNVVLLASMSILTAVLGKAEGKYQAKIEGRQKKAIANPTTVVKKEKIRPFLDLPKASEVKKEVKNATQVTPRVVTVKAERAEKKETKTIIVFPEAEELKQLLSGLSSHDRSRILRKIGEHTLRGVGKIEPIIEKAVDGSAQYKFRIGRVRVILVEDSSSNGVRRFVPTRIDWRDAVYKKSKAKWG